jgi:hypothetical protein
MRLTPSKTREFDSSVFVRPHPRIHFVEAIRLNRIASKLDTAGETPHAETEREMMSQFYADIQGNRGRVTRQGTKVSGLTGHIRGWTIGARIAMKHVDGIDICEVYRTTGSHGKGPDTLLARYTVNKP